MFINALFFRPITFDVDRNIPPMYNKFVTCGLSDELPKHMAERLQKSILV